MSPRVIALSLLVLATVAGGAYIVFGNEPTHTSIETDEDSGANLPGESQGRSAEPGKDSIGKRDDGGREQVPDEERGGTELEVSRRIPKGDCVVRARFVQDDKPLARREIGLRSLTRPGLATHRTDGEGRVEIQGLTAGRYRFFVEGKDMPRENALSAFRLEEGQERDLGDLRVPVPATLRGRLRAESGAVVALAQVTLGKPGFSDFLNGDEDAPAIKSDEQGAFELTRLAPGKFVLRVDHPAYLRIDRSVEIKEGEQYDLGTIELAIGNRIRGLVVDEQNKPIAGVHVMAEIQTRIGTSLVRGYSPARVVKTDDQGRFTVGGLGATTRLLLQKEGYQEKRDLDVDMAKGFVRIQLLTERGISGRVTGVPKGRNPEVKVYVAEHNSVGQGMVDLYVDRQDVKCDSRGFFQITGLEKGEYRLIAALDGYGFSAKEVVKLGEHPVRGIELVLGQGGELVVRAVDKHQRPIEDARVVLEAVDPIKAEPGRRVRMRGRSAIKLRERTDDQGVARIQGVFEGHARVSVQHDRYLGVSEELDLVQGRQEKQVVLSLGGWIEGIATSSTGHPAAGVEIQIAPKKPKGAGNVFEVDVGSHGGALPARDYSMRTGADGLFKTVALAPGLYEVWFSSMTVIRTGGAMLSFNGDKDKKPGLIEVQVTEGQVSKVQLRKPIAGTLEGLVTYKGLPASKAQVYAWPVGKDSFDSKQGITDNDGRFTIPDLEPGRWSYCAKPEKGGVATPVQEFEVPETGGDIQRNLELGGGVVSGRCMMTSGRPFPAGLTAVLEEVLDPGEATVKQTTRKISIMMTADEKGNRSLSQMVMRPPTDPEPVRVKKDGTFEIDYVAAGSWHLTIEGKGNVRIGSQDFQLAKDEIKDLGVIELAPVFPILIDVQDEQGQPAKMATLAVYRKIKGKPSERIWSGLVQKGKVRIPGLSAGLYRLRFGKIGMGPGERPEPQESDLEVQEDGRATGTVFGFK